MFQPSIQSLSGLILLKLEYTYKVYSPPQNQRCQAIVKRALGALALAFAALIDLAVWVLMTITVVPIFLVGVKNHLKNLISTFAVFFLAIGVLFGCPPKINYQRPFWMKNNALAQRVLRSHLREVSGRLCTSITNGINQAKKILPNVDVNKEIDGVSTLTYILTGFWHSELTLSNKQNKEAPELGVQTSTNHSEMFENVKDLILKADRVDLRFEQYLSKVRQAKELFEKNVEDCRLFGEGLSNSDSPYEVLLGRFLTNYFEYNDDERALIEYAHGGLTQILEFAEGLVKHAQEIIDLRSRLTTAHAKRNEIYMVMLFEQAYGQHFENASEDDKTKILKNNRCDLKLAQHITGFIMDDSNPKALIPESLPKV